MITPALLEQKNLNDLLEYSKINDIKKFGVQSMAYSALQEEMKEFRHPAFEGFEKISLGISPLYQRENGRFNASTLAESIFSFFYRTNLFYNYRSMGERKEQYKLRRQQTYLATRGGFSLRKLCGLLKVNNLV